MKDTQLIRNFGIFGHGKCGKTSLAEALLFTAGKTSRLGKVDDGSSCMDFEPEEINRNLSISSSFNQLNWNKNTFNITDTPGDSNFLNDAAFAAQVVDGAIFVIGAIAGVKPLTGRFAEYLSSNNLPTIIYISKMDRERANFERTVNSIKDSLPQVPAIIQLPIGSESNFKGVIDLISQQAYLFDGTSGKVNKSDIPENMIDDVARYRELLMEVVAETDDDLIEKFLEEGELTHDDLLNGLTRAVKSAKLCPILSGSAINNQATAPLLEAISSYLPSPDETKAIEGTNPKDDDIIERRPLASEPFSAIVFKTMADPYAGRLTIFRIISGTLSEDNFYNASKDKFEKFGQLLQLEGKKTTAIESAGPGMIVAVAKLKHTTTGDTLCDQAFPIIYDPPTPIKPVISYAVTTNKKDDEDKLFSSITKMLEEDPTLSLTRQKQTKEILISGVGQIHLTIVGEKIKRKFGVDLQLKLPKVPYLETIKGSCKVQYKHKKQSGGRGQYADNSIELQPLPRSEGYEFIDKIVGGVIPKQYIPAVDKGIQEAMANGVIAGFPVVDVKVTLYDGSFHNVDSSEMAFKIAGSMAFKKGAQDAKPVLLEPIMTVKVEIPKECVGDIIGDINSRRGKVMGMDSDEKSEVINLQVPMAEILEYAPDLTSITGGRGSFETEFSHYEEVPANLAEKIISAQEK